MGQSVVIKNGTLTVGPEPVDRSVSRFKLSIKAEGEFIITPDQLGWEECETPTIQELLEHIEVEAESECTDVLGLMWDWGFLRDSGLKVTIKKVP